MTLYTRMTSWISSEDKQYCLSQQTDIAVSPNTDTQETVISINESATYQSLIGWGATFMDSDVYHFQRMSPAVAETALRALFAPDDGAGWNMMRISFGSSDWNRDWHFYTYDDMPAGQRDDDDLSHFSIAEDIRLGHIDLLKKALRIQPDLRIIASVWGPPAWMKDNGKLISDGSIPSENYRVYATYLRKCIQAYAEQGIPIFSVTPQNEPLCVDGRLTPQALWLDWQCMRDFLLVLKDEFIAHGITTEIWAYDHNFVAAKTWVAPLLSDPAARTAIDAVAWHDYEGDPEEMSDLITQYPDMPMYLTERRQYSIDGMANIIRILRHGARSYLHWITISDEYFAPHQFCGGSDSSTRPLSENKLAALVSLRGSKDAVCRAWGSIENSSLVSLRNSPDMVVKASGYYLFAQLSRFIQRGAVRVGSRGDHDGLSHLAVKNPDNTLVVTVVNTTEVAQPFTIQLSDTACVVTLPGKSIGTYQFAS
ncbi:MAG TPA: glycoside hydrolase family 30 beta sandwich domain-containing protein [Armatimonadota bacterium]|nr:glycoside hydrolase family 30 beta sandwich domain-containing protein [Armatimonadota bacterium]